MKKIKSISIILIIILTISTVMLYGCEKEYVGDTTKLKISFYEAGFGRKWIESLAAAYEDENPGIKIILEGDPGLSALMNARLETRKASLLSDLYIGVSGIDYYRTWVRKDYLVDLTDLYSEVVEDDKTIDSLVNQTIKDYYTVNEAVYAVPWQDNTMGICYNAAMFEQYGWSEPATMDEFFALCIEIQKKGIAPIVYCGNTSYGYFPGIMNTWLAQAEGVNAMTEFYQMENAEVYQAQQLSRKKAYETVAKIVKGSNIINSVERPISLSGSRAFTHLAAQREFIKGNAAMVISGPWFQIEMSDFLKDYPNFRMKYMNPPHINADKKDKSGNDTSNIVFLTANSMVIPKGGVNEERAKDFIKFMLTQDNLNDFIKNTDGLTRPYIVDEYKYEGLTEFGASVLNVLAKPNESKIYGCSTAPIWLAKEVGLWNAQDGTSINKIINSANLNSAMTLAASYAVEDYTVAVEKFNRWVG